MPYYGLMRLRTYTRYSLLPGRFAFPSKNHDYPITDAFPKTFSVLPSSKLTSSLSLFLPPEIAEIDLLTSTEAVSAKSPPPSPSLSLPKSPLPFHSTVSDLRPNCFGKFVFFKCK
ncbi:hypothetical protein GOBAR_DD01150 [Gossypium barbadense]|nr:hypothetical protein GOBAR_DD01150 [Gossypium barbadense]